MNTPINRVPVQPVSGMPFDSEMFPDSEILHKARHDIRSAMHVVTGMSEVLSLSAAVPPREKEIIEIMKRNADRALALIDGLFDTLDQAKEDDEREPRENVTSPQAGAEEDGRSPQPAPQEFRQPRLRALVVEDDESNALVMTQFLEALRYDCDVAQSGEEALEKFAQRHYDIILMDVQMRGMDGLETTRHIRDIEMGKNLPTTPILGATGNATQDDRLFCSRAGMTDYISKPFSRQQLEKKLLCVMPLFRRSLN